MSSRDDCIRTAKPPQYLPGTVIQHGAYYRNLKKQHVARRLAKGTDEPPIGGRRLTKKFYKDAEAQEGFSVNCSTCQTQPSCSILLQPGPHHFEWVALIYLESMANLIGHALGAQYDPVGDNACHYNIVPLDLGSVGFWMLMRDVLDDYESSFPKGLPNTTAELVALEAKAAEFEHVIELVHPSIADTAEVAQKLAEPETSQSDR